MLSDTIASRREEDGVTPQIRANSVLHAWGRGAEAASAPPNSTFVTCQSADHACDGACRGIGHATVKLYQDHGWKILTISRHPFSDERAWPDARDSHIQAGLPV
jgi:hypothetical protein